jgi:hypothetical protein
MHLYCAIRAFYHYYTGFERHFLSLQEFLYRQPFGDRLEIIGVKEEAFTKNFDVMIGDDQQLVHSKESAQQGCAQSELERIMICEFIEEYLEDVVT